MAKQCDYAHKCPITRYFTAQQREIMFQRYCLGSYDKCHRYQLRQQDQPVSDDVMPWDGVTEIDPS